MATKIFVNLPVKNLYQSIGFFLKLGYRFDPKFTDEKGTCMIIGEDIYVMLLLEEFFSTFTKKQLGDASKTTEVILALSADSREQVDTLVNNAIASGGSSTGEPQDNGWMYGRQFQDLDGHLWESLYIDASE